MTRGNHLLAVRPGEVLGEELTEVSLTACRQCHLCMTSPTRFPVHCETNGDSRKQRAQAHWCLRPVHPFTGSRSVSAHPFVDPASAVN